MGMSRLSQEETPWHRQEEEERREKKVQEDSRRERERERERDRIGFEEVVTVMAREMRWHRELAFGGFPFSILHSPFSISCLTPPLEAILHTNPLTKLHSDRSEQLSVVEKNDMEKISYPILSNPIRFDLIQPAMTFPGLPPQI